MNVTTDRPRVLRVVKEGWSTLRRMFPETTWRPNDYSPTMAFATAAVVLRDRGGNPTDVKTLQLLAVLAMTHMVAWSDIGVEVVDACDATTREYGS